MTMAYHALYYDTAPKFRSSNFFMIKTWTSYQATFWNVLAPVDIVWVAQNQHNIELAISKSCKDNWDKIAMCYELYYLAFSVF